MPYKILIALVAIIASFTAQGRDYQVTAFGAKGDGKTDNTLAIQRCIDACAKTGGRVIIPAGIFITGSLTLKSNITLYLSENSTLQGSTDLSKYKKTYIKTYRSHVDTYPPISLLYAEGQENITITGKGTFYGSGDAKPFQDSIDNSLNRPFGIKFVKCKNIEVSHIKMRNSAFWMQLYLACDKVLLTDLNIYNQANMNNDGIDIDGCKDVIISNCFIDACDDNICLKSNGPRFTEAVVISNCVLSTHCYAFKCGTESVGGFKNITVSNITVRQCDTKVTPKNGSKDVSGFGQTEGQAAIALEIVDGGVMDNINISNFTIDSIETPIFIKLGNRLRPAIAGIPAVNNKVLRNVHISNIVAKNAGRLCTSITGYPGANIEAVTLNNIYIQTKGEFAKNDTSLTVPENSDYYPRVNMFNTGLPASGFYLRHVNGIKLSNISLSTAPQDIRPFFVLDDVQRAIITNYTLDGGTSDTVFILKDSGQIIIEKCRQFKDFKHPLKVLNPKGQIAWGDDKLNTFK